MLYQNNFNIKWASDCKLGITFQYSCIEKKPKFSNYLLGDSFFFFTVPRIYFWKWEYVFLAGERVHLLEMHLLHLKASDT